MIADSIMHGEESQDCARQRAVKDGNPLCRLVSVAAFGEPQLLID